MANIFFLSQDRFWLWKLSIQKLSMFFLVLWVWRVCRSVSLVAMLLQLYWWTNSDLPMRLASLVLRHLLKHIISKRWDKWLQLSANRFKRISSYCKLTYLSFLSQRRKSEVRSGKLDNCLDLNNAARREAFMWGLCLCISCHSCRYRGRCLCHCGHLQCPLWGPAVHVRGVMSFL